MTQLLTSSVPQSGSQSFLASISASVDEDFIRALMGGEENLSDSAVVTLP